MKKIHTSKAPAAIGPYSQAIVSGEMVYTSGQIALNPESGCVEVDGIVAQTEQVIKNLGEVLKAANSDFSQVIKTTCFLSDMADFAAFNEVYSKYMTEKPARSCVEASRLPKDVLVEVEAIALVKKES